MSSTFPTSNSWQNYWLSSEVKDVSHQKLVVQVLSGDGQTVMTVSSVSRQKKSVNAAFYKQVSGCLQPAVQRALTQYNSTATVQAHYHTHLCYNVSSFSFCSQYRLYFSPWYGNEIIVILFVVIVLHNAAGQLPVFVVPVHLHLLFSPVWLWVTVTVCFT